MGVAVVLVALTLSFVLLKAAPGDPYASNFESGISPAAMARRRVARGYDKPVAEQYGRYLALVLRGDMGESTSLHEPVISAIRRTVPRTVGLMVIALATSVLAGIAIGAWQGANDGSRRERTLNMVVRLAYSIPEFWLATVIMLLFAVWLGLFPLSGMTTTGGSGGGVISRLLDRVHHLVLPWLSLSIIGTAVFARYQRSAMRDVIREPYVRTARAKGVSERIVVCQHALRVAMLPVLTVLGLWLPALLGGAVFVEQVFGWPGMGRLLVDGIAQRDYDLVTGCVIVGSAMTVAGSLLADALREFADPRLRA